MTDTKDVGFVSKSACASDTENVVLLENHDKLMKIPISHLITHCLYQKY